MEENDKDKKVGIRVVDRRRFDSDGNEREFEEQIIESQAKAKPVAQEVKKPEAVKSNPEADKSEKTKNFTMQASNPEGPEEVPFSAFVVSMATQALVQLGDMKPPPGMEIPLDPETAKQTIDILAMLQRKTVGNLEPVEERLMVDILHNLRIAYLRHKKQ